MSVIAVIPAAGFGRRMGSDISKQHLDLAGRPVLYHTLQIFEQHPAIDRICLVVPAAEVEDCRHQVMDLYGFGKVVDIVAGGRERQDSVRNGLLGCRAKADDIVLIHDGVRPLFDAALIPPLLTLVREAGAAIIGVPVKDTIKEVVDGKIVATPPRGRLWQAQTPQGFRYDLILQAHQTAERDGYLGTDDASLLERDGVPVSVLEGDGSNLKITTPEDMPVAEALIACRQRSEL
ncbi:MAG: 2-C-methyl-D-erythritol 4-phosphate cytidylyltransferase [Desulfuromonas sp.]|nr:MAG: 2-C-methyl-D-erythritol 4-phosphate cytidylyltransferase [Desulfuromonas sp.]